MHRKPSLSIVVVIGHMKLGSHTSILAQRVGHVIQDRIREDSSQTVAWNRVEVAEMTSELLQRESPVVRTALAKLMSADILVIASPTYRATYSGLLKLVLDMLPGDALAGALAVPVMMADSPEHTKAADLYLRPVLLELGAACPTPAVTLVKESFDDLDERVGRWVRPLSHTWWTYTLAAIACNPRSSNTE